MLTVLGIPGGNRSHRSREFNPGAWPTGQWGYENHQAGLQIVSWGFRQVPIGSNSGILGFFDWFTASDGRGSDMGG
jgi:hypothetical protein